VFLAACEKSGPVEVTQGSSASPTPDAVVVAIADAGVATLPKPSLDDEAVAYADKLTAVSGSNDPGDMATRRPGAALPPAGRIVVGRPLDDSTLTPDVVLAKINTAYMRGIKRCYTNHLKTHPDAAGKLALEFTVGETGATSNASTRGFAKPVDECITKQIASWRFLVPRDSDGDKTSASFKISLTMVP
jgi:hypothetical protein